MSRKNRCRPAAAKPVAPSAAITIINSENPNIGTTTRESKGGYDLRFVAAYDAAGGAGCQALGLDAPIIPGQVGAVDFAGVADLLNEFGLALDDRTAAAGGTRKGMT